MIGASTDSEYVHLAWREQHPGLKNLTIPMVADSVNCMNVGRNVDEVLRVLNALQTDELIPCNWNPGQETLSSKLSKEQQN